MRARTLAKEHANSFVHLLMEWSGKQSEKWEDGKKF